MDIFKKGSQWETSRVSDLEKSRKVAWIFAGGAMFAFVVAAVALASLVPLRRTIPYVVRQDVTTGNVEVLQAFDNRTIGSQELLAKHWARAYVLAREQYNWWLVGSDYDLVSDMTDPTIFGEYSAQFSGPKSLDKVFGDSTERRITILSVTPSPTNASQMVIRFTRTTKSKGTEVEPPTNFVVNMAYRFIPKTFGAEADLIRNPMGFQVYAYRRDAEAAPSAPVGTTAPAGQASGARQ